MKRLVNAITCTRFVFALILVLAAPGSAWFWAAYGLGAVSDVLDGLLARRFGVQSDGGARLDSAADIAFLLALTAALLRAATGKRGDFSPYFIGCKGGNREHYGLTDAGNQRDIPATSVRNPQRAFDAGNNSAHTAEVDYEVMLDIAHNCARL